MAIVAEREVKPESQPPTTLNLLHFRTPSLDAVRINNFREELGASIRFEGQCRKTGIFLKNLSSEAEKRLERIAHSEQDFRRDGENLVSSGNFANVYLKMREAFSQMNFKDFIAAFKESLRLILATSKLVGWEDFEINNRNSQLAVSPNNKINNELNRMIYESLNTIPGGFTQGLSAWQSFLTHPDNFINGVPSSNKRVGQKHSHKANMVFIVSSGIPDWFSDDMTDEPDKTAVEEEMKEDNKGQENFDEQLSKSYQQKLLITNAAVGKLKEALQWTSDKRKVIFTGNLNMTRLVLFFHLAEHSENPIREVVKGTKINFTDNNNYLAETGDKQIEDKIKQYSESEDILKNPETYALFIEKQLADTGINPSGKFIDNDFIKFIDMVITSNKGSLKESLPKRSAGAINYGLKPLIDILDAGEIDYIKEFLNTYTGHSIEYFIWEISELLASKIRTSSSLSDPGKRVLSKVREFLATFLRKNWRWIYANLKIELAEIDKGKSIVEATDQSTIISLDNNMSQNPSEEIQTEGIEQTISEFQKGNLSGWKLYYSNNRSTDSKYLTAINGDTLEEKEEGLGDFILKNQISSSIKSSSIINTFDWLVTVPKEIEEIRMGKTVYGERWKKIKRGPVRIFYIMDEATKQIIFFLHQKQAWSYGF